MSVVTDSSLDRAHDRAEAGLSAITPGSGLQQIHQGSTDPTSSIWQKAATE
jgi:hypothetical protein